MLHCNFNARFYQYHHNIKLGLGNTPDPDFENKQEIWLNIFGLGKFEVFQFIYSQCNGIEHFNEWITSLKGADFVAHATIKFNNWAQDQPMVKGEVLRLLSAEQHRFWETHGYLKVSNLLPVQHIDAVKELICKHLNINISEPASWYQQHEDWHGLMLQLYQDESINEIRNNPSIFNLFAELYDNSNIIANIDKLSFNPPETADWLFSHDKLHWDIDPDRLDENYIQGLVYLDDVPENGGAFKAVTGFHKKFKTWINKFESLHDAHNEIREQETGTLIPGEKGDVIIWRNTLPHAASRNKSTRPRFVQYISFSKL
ncbi:phytanoyl-CoA dioxygenase family protein [Pedobacter nototheniae]|uniref:phytanoyl-CoA dioxygenase family protein n=1 Tax=Pedobacter nototheniae TaxID=2488994 RepID=UPI002930B5EE|nr:phytanoyl-CoA dioxygenase family protein [Pedobacter nototheniae]